MANEVTTGDPVKSNSRPFAGVRMAPEARSEVQAEPTIAGPVVPGSTRAVGYNGGPIIACPQIYASFWGRLWQEDAAHKTRATRLAQFLTDLPNSTFMNVLSQYGAGGGAGEAGAFFQSSFFFSWAWYLEIAIKPRPPLNTVLSDSGITEVLQGLIDRGAIPDGSDPRSQGTVVVVVFLDETLSFVDSTGYPSCSYDAGYHFFFATKTGRPMYYAVIASLSDDCIKAGCGPNPSWPGGCNFSLSWTQEQRVTTATSHEFAEICTDPQPFTGWVYEIGDVCAGGTAQITVGANTWSVQPVYDLTNDISSAGAAPCSASAPQPLWPQNSWGVQLPDTSSQLAAASAVARFREGHADRLLPLPPVYVDENSPTVSICDADLRHYLVKMVHPMKHSELLPLWPQMLRDAADLIESRKL